MGSQQVRRITSFQKRTGCVLLVSLELVIGENIFLPSLGIFLYQKVWFHPSSAEAPQIRNIDERKNLDI